MKQLFSLFKLLSLLCFILALSACGFHLRGDVSLPPEIHTFYVTGNSPYSPIIQQIRHVFKSSGITLVDSPEQAPVTLFVLSDNLSWSQTTIGSSGSLRDNSVTYSVSYTLRNSFGEVLVGPLSVSAAETVTTLSNELLDNSNKLKQAQRDLTQGVITQMIFQISSRNTIKILSKAIKHQKPKHKLTQR